MDTLISSSSALFTSTTGFSLDSVVDFAGSQILILIGMGLGVFQALLPWLMILAAIGVVIGLVYAGFRFFRH